eukprot:PhF_6_TR3356/c0_g1_i1/m.4764
MRKIVFRRYNSVVGRYPSLMNSSKRFSSNNLHPPPTTTTTHHHITDVTRFIESNPESIMTILERLDPATRRKLIVAGGAMEWFGREDVEKELMDADTDRDQNISGKDLHHWIDNALERKGEKDSTSSSSTVPYSALLRIAVTAGVPFVGFGFLDNALMLLAGEAIDTTMGMYLNGGALAVAALGNVVSGSFGIQAHGILDRVWQQYGPEEPRLTHEQLESRVVFLARHMGGTFGVTLGLVIGMVPLLFLSDPEERQASHQYAELVSKVSVVTCDDAIKSIRTHHQRFYTFDEIGAVLVERQEPLRGDSVISEKEYIKLVVATSDRKAR